MTIRYRSIIILAGAAFLSGCSLGDFDFSDLFPSGIELFKAPPKVTQAEPLPPAPQPIYAPGYTYVYNQDGELVQEQVVSVSPDRVVWTNDKGLIWTTSTNIVTPPISWSSDAELGRGRQTIIGNPHLLFPLQEGKQVAFGVRGNSENVPTGWRDENKCAVIGQTDVTVSAGQFTTFRIDCQRRDFVASLFYAPIVQHFVLRVRKFEANESRKELVSVALSNDRTKAMAKKVDHSEEMKKPHADTMAPKSAIAMTMAPVEKKMEEHKKDEGKSKMSDTSNLRLNTIMTRLENVVAKLEVMSAGGTMASPMAAGKGDKMEMKDDHNEAKMQSKGGKWGGHLASYRTTKGAKRGWRALSRKINALSDMTYRTVEYDSSDGKGSYMRLVAGAFKTKSAAAKFCKTLSKRKQYCKAVRAAP